MQQQIIGLAVEAWGFNDSSGHHRDRVDVGDRPAKDGEISWNGYPLPQGLRITDIKPRMSMSDGPKNWIKATEPVDHHKDYADRKAKLRRQLSDA